MGEKEFNKALFDFISCLKYASHVVPLLENESLSVKFCSPDYNGITMFINKQDVWLDYKNSERPSLIISGDVSSLLELVEGRTRLQVLKKRGEINVKGKFRNILKLESLIYCCSFAKTS
ncbi:hypothetical protein P9265_08050 [Schinkia azotoformans]|uniref:hypothetical protein n=1 Tax=Schinkia azotoformans TaxID=1454 RepID=UPI002DB9087C|nr:hypothetical protein [Schinkia azotoformans]MEC1720771.1 hypothetical protein [Schinkia azotoformans]MED4352281.1 hypothetical protein [Schinkia azotoformans]MED4411910.1 hypothetical protein [Schinkia azotoformans]